MMQPESTNKQKKIKFFYLEIFNLEILIFWIT